MTSDPRLRFVRDEQFHQLFRGSAFLAREFFGQIESHRFENSSGGSKIAYVFDTSVLSALTAPWSVGPLQGRSRHGLGQLLPRMYQAATEFGLSEEDRKLLRVQRAAEDRLSIRVTELLAKASVDASHKARFQKEFDEVTDAPLWQLSAHFEETNFMGDAIAGRVESMHGERRQQSEDDRREHLKRYVALALKSWAAQGERHRIEDFLDYVVDEIMTREVLSGFGVARQSASLKEFKRQKFSLKELSDFPIHGIELLFGEDYSPMERVAQEFLEKYWSERLQRKFRATASNTSRVRRDAEALTELSILNRRILDHGFDLRIVLVTGDRNLVEASYNGSDRIETSLDDHVGRYYGGNDFSDYRRRSKFLEEFFLNAANGSAGVENWFDRFSLRYVRHLHAFAHDEIAEGEQTEKVFSFLSGLFAETAGSILQERGLLEDISLGRTTETPPDGFRENFLDVIENWDRLSRRKVKESRFSSWHALAQTSQSHLIQIIRDDLQKLSGGDSDGSLTFGAAVIWMAEYVDRTRDRTMLHFSNLGTDLLQGRHGGWIVRNPPDLQFSNLQKSMEIFRKLCSTPGYEGGAQDAFHQDFEAIIEDVPEDQREDGRLESHLQFLALGAAFAAADRWSVAESHAQRALAILDRAALHDVIPSIPPIMDANGDLVCQFSGREARFLSAVCKRIRAETNTDLDDAEAELARSFKAFESDRAAGEGFLGSTLLELRYDAELMSIMLSRYYIVRSECRTEHCVNHSETDACPNCRGAHDRLFEASGELFSKDRFDKLLTKESSISALSLAANIVQLNVIRAYWEREQGADIASVLSEWTTEEVLLAALEHLDHVQVEKRIIFNETARAYKAVGSYVASKRGIQLEEPPEIAAVSDVITGLRNHLVTSYDGWRFRRLRRFLEREKELTASAAK